MPRVNWNAIKREEERLERGLDEGRITIAEYRKAINDLHREAREEFEEQLREEYRDEFGG